MMQESKTQSLNAFQVAFSQQNWHLNKLISSKLWEKWKSSKQYDIPLSPSWCLKLPEHLKYGGYSNIVGWKSPWTPGCWYNNGFVYQKLYFYYHFIIILQQLF